MILKSKCQTLKPEIREAETYKMITMEIGNKFGRDLLDNLGSCAVVSMRAIECRLTA